MASENLKKVITLVAKTAANAETVFKDGFQPLTDILSFIPELSQVPELLKHKDEIITEFKALNSEGIKDLVAYTEEVLVLENKKAEEVVEASLAFVGSGFNLFEKVKALKTAPVVATDGTIVE